MGGGWFPGGSDGDGGEPDFIVDPPDGGKQFAKIPKGGLKKAGEVFGGEAEYKEYVKSHGEVSVYYDTSEGGGSIPGFLEVKQGSPELLGAGSGLAMLDTSGFPGGYSADVFELTDIVRDELSDTDDLSDAFDDFHLAYSIAISDIVNPLEDMSVNSTVPTVLGSFRYLPSMIEGLDVGETIEDTSITETYSINVDSVAQHQKRAREYYDGTSRTIGNYIISWESHINSELNPWVSEKYNYQEGGWSSSGADAYSVGAEAEVAFCQDMVWAEADSEYATAVGATWANEGRTARDVSYYETLDTDAGSHRYDYTTIGGQNNIDGRKSINLRLTQANYVQPYIAKELYICSKSWLDVKRLIEDSSRLRGGTYHYFRQNSTDLGIGAGSSSQTGGYNSNYYMASYLGVAPNRGYAHATDIPSHMAYSINSMKNRWSGDTPLDDVISGVLWFPENAPPKATGTKWYSQIVYDLHRSLDIASCRSNPSSHGSGVRVLSDRLQPNIIIGGDAKNVLDAMKSIGSVEVSDDQIGDFIESLPSTGYEKISMIFGFLGRDWIQNIAMNNNQFHKEFNAKVATILLDSGIVDSPTDLGDLSDLEISSSTTRESLLELIFGVANGISVNNLPPTLSLMSTAIVGSSSDTGVLPIESFCAESMDTDPNVYSPGYDYFVEELVSAAETFEGTVSGRDLYSFYGTLRSNIPYSGGNDSSPENTNADHGYAPGFGWTPENRILPNQIHGSRTAILLEALVSLSLKHLTLNRAFGVSPLGESNHGALLKKGKLHDFAPTTGFFYYKLLDLLSDVSVGVLSQFSGVGTDSANFTYSRNTSDRARELAILGYIAEGSTSLKTKYIRYCEELYKLKLASDDFSDFEGASDPGISFIIPGSDSLVFTTFDDEYISALNNVQSTSSNFILACEILAEALFDEFEPKDTTFGVPEDERTGGSPFGDFSMDVTNPLEKIKVKYQINLDVDSESGTFNSILLTPIGSALTEALINSSNLIGIVTNAILDGDSNMRKYAKATPLEGSSMTSSWGSWYEPQEPLMSDTSISGPAVDLLTPHRGASGAIEFSSSDTYGFNALTYIRAASIAYLELISDTIGSQNYEISTDLTSSDFFSDSPSPTATFLDDEQVICEINTKSFHSFFLGAWYSGGRSNAHADESMTTPKTYSTWDGDPYKVSGLHQTYFTSRVFGGYSDTTGDSHFLDSEHQEMYFEHFHNKFFYPVYYLNQEDVTMFELFTSLLHIANHWKNNAHSIIRPNKLRGKQNWKKWLQYSAFNAITRELGYMTSSESIKLMKHNIREFMSYGISTYQTMGYDNGRSWIGSWDTDTANAPRNYAAGGKTTSLNRSLLSTALKGQWPSGIMTIEEDEVNLGASLTNERFDQDKKILTIGLPAGFVDKMRREAYSNASPSEMMSKEHTNSLLKISIYKYDLENDSIYYPEPMSFIVDSSLFAPTAFPDLTADYLLGNISGKSPLSSMGETGSGTLFDIPSMIGDPSETAEALMAPAFGDDTWHPPLWTMAGSNGTGARGITAILSPKHVPRTHSAGKDQGLWMASSMSGFPTVDTPAMLFRLTMNKDSNTSKFGYWAGYTDLSYTRYSWWYGLGQSWFEAAPCHFFAIGDAGSFGAGSSTTSAMVGGKNVQFTWNPDEKGWDRPYSETGYGSTVSGGVMIGYNIDDGFASLQTEDRELSILRFTNTGTASQRAQAVINCTKDRILKEYMRLYSGIDMREVGFPAMGKDTDFCAYTGINDGYPAYGRRNQPCNIQSNSSSPRMKSKASPSTLDLSPAFLGAFLNFEECSPSQRFGVRGALGLWGSWRGQPFSGCSPGEPLRATLDLWADQNIDNGERSKPNEVFSSADYFDYENSKMKTVGAMTQFFVNQGWSTTEAKKMVKSNFKTHELGAPVYRAMATLPNKFERTFSFLIDCDEDFDATILGEDGSSTEAPDHKSNLFGFYATVELVE